MKIIFYWILAETIISFDLKIIFEIKSINTKDYFDNFTVIKTRWIKKKPNIINNLSIAIKYCINNRKVCAVNWVMGIQCSTFYDFSLTINAFKGLWIIGDKITSILFDICRAKSRDDKNTKGICTVIYFFFFCFNCQN